jgi:hypothetical protein
LYNRKKWTGWWDLNPRPQQCQTLKLNIGDEKKEGTTIETAKALEATLEGRENT